MSVFLFIPLLFSSFGYGFNSVDLIKKINLFIYIMNKVDWIIPLQDIYIYIKRKSEIINY